MTQICPWAESNQGLLSAIQGVFSAIALIVALVALVREASAGRRARSERIADFSKAVLDLCDELTSSGRRTIEQLQDTANVV